MRGPALAWAGLLLLARPAFAQDLTGDAACGQLLDEVALGCVELVGAQAEVEKLELRVFDLTKQSSDVTRPEAERQEAKTKLDALKPELDEAKKSVEELTDTPFEKLDGFCVSIDQGTRRTCDSLATRLGPFDDPAKFDAKSLKPVIDASSSQELEVKRDLLPAAAAADRRTANNKGGSSAQVDPVESVQPITVAGGALALSGSHSGSKGVGTISVNPLALAMPDDYAMGRLFDLSVSAPFDLTGESANQDPYISTRLRVNITGPIRAKELQALVDAWLERAGIYADKLEQVLFNAEDVTACATYIAEHHRASASACQQDVDPDDVRAARLEAYAAMARARREADRYYLGIDARFDTGDPTGPAVTGDLGEHGLGGLAAGIRIPQGQRKLWDWELRTRAALDLFKSRDPAILSPSLVGSFDWGAAVIFSGRLQETAKQRMAFGIGAEGRHAFSDSESADLSPTNYVKLNLMAVVPALTGGDVGLAIGFPLWELREVQGVVATFSTDLGLLDHSL